MLDLLLSNYAAACILVLITAVFAMIMSANVNGTFKKYNKIKSQSGVPAHIIARQILDANGLSSVDVVRVSGNLTDHYDPTTGVVALSDSVYNNDSVSAIGVTAHECGHAIQHAEGYIPIKIRTAIFPAVNIAQHSWIWILIVGFVASFEPLIMIGIVFFAFMVLFQAITLPVEFDASRRALNTISSEGLLTPDEQTGARKTLSAAAMTYVASLALSIAQLIRILASANRRR